MARAPRAKVSATSGQGISRLAYQKAYAMKGGLTSKFTGARSDTPPRDYGKGKKAEVPKGINVSYGDTYWPTDLKDIEEFGKG